MIILVSHADTDSYRYDSASHDRTTVLDSESGPE